MPSQRKRSERGTPAKKARRASKPEGLFGKALLDNLKKMPPGTPDATIIQATLRTVPPEKVKAALGKASPRERQLFFSVIPEDAVRAIVGSLSAGLLAPDRPPPEQVPSPRGGPPASILQTSYVNEPFPPAAGGPDWTHNLTGGQTIKDFGSGVYEWTPVYDPSEELEGLSNPVVGLTGWAIPSSNPWALSKGDVWFTHPFGFDWEYYIAPDPQYESLLASNSANTGVDPDDPTKETDHDYNLATTIAQELGLPVPSGVLGVEIDQNLVPTSFRDTVAFGTRIATFGRWIVDSGHPDFHTEIHPPLLMATATPAPPPTVRASEMTHVEIMSRPYTVSQRFPEGNFVDHLIVEVAKVEDTTLGIPSSLQVEAHPTVVSPPHEGRPFIKLLVKPPVPRNKRVLPQQRLIVNFHFTARSGVAVQAFDAGNDTVGLAIVLGDHTKAALPPRHDFTVQWKQLGDEYSYIIDALQIADILLGKALSAAVLNRDILTDIYDPPVAASPHDFENIAGPVPIDDLPVAPLPGFQTPPGLSLDDDQPFPIYGWMNVYWMEEQIVLE